jgi:GMP synthase (glutamine-hydrolysing)
MTMRCVALRHVAFEDLGLFEPVPKHRGYEIDYVQAGRDVLSRQDWVDADLVAVLGGPISACWACKRR